MDLLPHQCARPSLQWQGTAGSAVCKRAGMRPKEPVRDIDVGGKRVLVRVDFNVPLDDSGQITDDTRIRAAIPTIQYLLDHDAAVILASHLGRPKGKPNPRLSLAPVAERLSALIERPVALLPDSVGSETQVTASGLRAGDVVLLENLRFHDEEEANDSEFARSLAGLADIYVNDAFGTAHRAHASTAGVAAYLPAVSGLLMERELRTLGKVMADPPHPLVAIIGGSKISTKIGVLRSLLERVDRLCVGGAMACTFLKANGLAMGRSLVEE